MELISGDKFEEEEVEVDVEVPGLDPVVVVVGEEGEVEVEVVGDEKGGEVEVAVEGDGVVQEEGGVVCVCGLKGSHGINLTLTFNVPVRFYKLKNDMKEKREKERRKKEGRGKRKLE